MGKCTLIVDGNWLLQSRLFAVKGMFKPGLSSYEHGHEALKTLLSQSLVGVINYLPIVNDVILVHDGGSWRKDIEKPKCYSESYKENRVRDKSEINWPEIFNAFREWTETAKEIGMTVSHSYGAEGDDWIAYWAKTLNDKGHDCIIWSTDHDLQQLVDLRLDSTFTVVFEKKYGIVMHEKANKEGVLPLEFFLEPMDSFNMTWLKEHIETKKYVNPYDIVMEKVVCGDAGDNIKSIIRKPSGTRTNKVGPKEWLKCKQALSINKSNFIDSRDAIVSYLFDLKKFKDFGIDNPEKIQEAKDMFDFNIKLVTLSLDIIPSHLFENAEYKDFKVSDIKNNYKTLSGVGYEVTSSIDSLVEELPF